MSAPIIKKLQETLDRLRVERAVIDEQIAHFEGVLAYYEGNPEQVETRAVPPKSLRNAMWEILKEEGSPLHFKEIYERLKARGIQVAGKEPDRNVGAHLSADERFKSLGQGMWGLASRPAKEVEPSRGGGAAQEKPDGVPSGEPDLDEGVSRIAGYIHPERQQHRREEIADQAIRSYRRGQQAFADDVIPEEVPF